MNGLFPVPTLIQRTLAPSNYMLASDADTVPMETG